MTIDFKHDQFTGQFIWSKPKFLSRKQRGILFKYLHQGKTQCIVGRAFSLKAAVTTDLF